MLEQWFADAASEIQQGQHFAQLAEAKLRHISAVKWESMAGINFKRRVEDMHARTWSAVQDSREAAQAMPGIIAGMASMDQDLRDLQSDVAQGFVDQSVRLSQLVQVMAEVGMNAPVYLGQRGVFNPLSTS
jgi:hypothetical protein